MYMHQESLSFHIQRIQLNDQLLEIDLDGFKNIQLRKTKNMQSKKTIITQSLFPTLDKICFYICNAT